ncbi:MAG TPA: hypothetical protein VN937_07390 [Blastocatellia bacterium]|nr:hypothetical protein [Blastocatellia bacterium]
MMKLHERVTELQCALVYQDSISTGGFGPYHECLSTVRFDQAAMMTREYDPRRLALRLAPKKLSTNIQAWLVNNPRPSPNCNGIVLLAPPVDTLPISRAGNRTRA